MTTKVAADPGSDAFKEAVMPSASDVSMPEGSSGVQLGPLSKPILTHLLRLYNGTASAVDFEIYASNATFEDPLLAAHGVPQIKSAFYSMPLIFSECKIAEYSVEEFPTRDGFGDIHVHNRQHYKVGSSSFDVVSLIKLKIEEGKVVRHEDWWKKKPLWRFSNFGPLGFGAEGIRHANMLLTHALMGFGKDRSK